jgi:FixJ family two-component response regulator
MTVLVVLPDAIERAFCVDSLTCAGFSVSQKASFANGWPALAARPGVLVTDVRLGPHNGLPLAAIGRKVNPRRAVVITSIDDDPVLQRYTTEIAGAFVVKPLRTSQLIAAVYRAVLPEPNADGTIERRPSDPDEMRGQPFMAGHRRQERRHRGRRRRMATFLCLESLRRRP